MSKASRDVSSGARPSPENRLIPALLVVAGCAGFYSFWLSRLCVERHRLFQSGATDLGIYHQIVWLISRGKPAFSTLGHWHFLGDHFNPILYLISPLMWIHPGPETLLWVQVLALAASAIIFFQYARSKWESSWNACGLALAFLLYAPASLVALDDFHPEVLAIPFLLGAVCAFERKNAVAYWITLSLAMCCKENVALVVIAMGIAQLMRGQWKIGCATSLVGLGIAYVTTQILIPEFRGHSYHQAFFYYSYGNSLPEAAIHLLRHPSLVVKRLLENQSLLYLGQLFLPLVFLPFLSPISLLPALPTLGLNLMSDWLGTRMITFHYTALMFPFLWIAVVNALETKHQKTKANAAGRRLFGRMAPATLGVILLLIGNNLSNVKGFAGGWHKSYLSPTDPARLHTMERAVYRIPTDDPSPTSVAASFYLVPHVSSRQRVYWFPIPFRNFDREKNDELWPLQQLTPSEFEGSIDRHAVDFILLDRAGNFSPYKERCEFESDLRLLLESKRYETIMSENGILLLRRIGLSR